MEQDRELNHESISMSELWVEGLRKAKEARNHQIVPPPHSLRTLGYGSTPRGSQDSGIEVTPLSSQQPSQPSSDNGLDLSASKDNIVLPVRHLGKEDGNLSPKASALVVPSSSSSSQSEPDRNDYGYFSDNPQAYSQTISSRVATAERREDLFPKSPVHYYLADLEIARYKEASRPNGSATQELALTKHGAPKGQNYGVNHDRSTPHDAGGLIGGLLHSNEFMAPVMTLDKEDWNWSTLLDLTNTVRVATKRMKFNVEQLEKISAVFWKMLADESSLQRRVSLDLILYTRVDKLITEMLDAEKNPGQKDDLRRVILARATSLQHKWYLRFKNEIFTIEKRRMAELQERGHLHNVHLTQGDRKDGQKWAVNNETRTTPEIEGGQKFKVGDWWMNMVCAYRDGIISNPMNTMTKSNYGTVALALLTGKEEDGPSEGCYQYTKEGSEREIIRLMGLALNRGRPVRILRGYMLNSKYAPIAGVRYDGLYKVASYNRLPHDEADGNLYTCRIILERYISKQEMENLLQIPSPSQLDDWALYHRILGQDIRERDGDVRYGDWKSWLEKVEMEREQASNQRSIQGHLQKFSLDLSTATA